MARILCNWDVSSLYPNLIRIFGFSSRNQKDAYAYTDLLTMRMKAKHNELEETFLAPLGLTNADLKDGLKLPLNAYSGALRATFNKLFDPLQGFSICTTGQLLILQLIHDLQRIPTLEMVSANTDAVMYTIEENYKTDAETVLTEWQKHTGLELEEDKIVKICMRDVNNYCEIVQTGENDYEVHYKGSEFKRGNHKFKWNKERAIFEYKFVDDVENNSLSIVAEALLKNLLFNKPLEDTIMGCNDIFRFQMISHLGSTYEKCVQESPNGDIELQRNNRIYAGLKESGAIIKVKPDGRRDSLANCPPNPIVDNANHCSIEDINKKWYIKIARTKLNDFKGVTRMEARKKDELLAIAEQRGLAVDKKIKKVDLVKLIENDIESDEINGVQVTPIEIKKEREMCTMNIYEKLNQIKKEIREHDFIMDQVMPGNLGEKEYASIGQYYSILQEKCLKHKVFFQWNVVNMPYDIKENIFKPTTGKPSHVATVKCIAVFVNTEKKDEMVTIDTMASGSDICDKAVSGASTLAFRNFFDKNFTPKYMNTVEEINTNEEEQTAQPSIPTYIPETKKEEIKKEVVATPQKDSNDDDDAKRIITNIMKVRELSGNDTWGTQTLDSLSRGEYTSADILEIDLKVQAKLESLGAE